MRWRTLRVVTAGALMLAIEARLVEAADSTIVGEWCGEQGYGLNVEGDAIRFHPRPNRYAAPAINVHVDRDRATYTQYYDEPSVTVDCTLLLTDGSTATETCSSPNDAFYPLPGESAVLRRCPPALEPESEPQPQPGV